MTDDTTNLVLEHLRAIRADMAKLREEANGNRSQLSALRQEFAGLRSQMGAHGILLEQCLEDIASIRVRLDRIECRLDLVDVAK